MSWQPSKETTNGLNLNFQERFLRITCKYTRAEARGIEQFLIESNGGPGILANNIYSITRSNPSYAKLVEIGEILLYFHNGFHLTEIGEKT